MWNVELAHYILYGKDHVLEYGILILIICVIAYLRYIYHKAESEE